MTGIRSIFLSELNISILDSEIFGIPGVESDATKSFVLRNTQGPDIPVPKMYTSDASI